MRDGSQRLAALVHGQTLQLGRVSPLRAVACALRKGATAVWRSRRRWVDDYLATR